MLVLYQVTVVGILFCQYLIWVYYVDNKATHIEPTIYTPHILPQIKPTSTSNTEIYLDL